MLGAPDIYASREALDRCFAHLRPQARVVFFGAKTVSERGAISRLFRSIFASLTFRSTPQLDMTPWRLVSARTVDCSVEELAFGWMFLASATLPPTGAP